MIRIVLLSFLLIGCGDSPIDKKITEEVVATQKSVEKVLKKEAESKLSEAQKKSLKILSETKDKATEMAKETMNSAEEFFNQKVEETTELYEETKQKVLDYNSSEEDK
jgi:F0F1-type ATP synthase membrane subunit b/b'